MKRKPMVQMLKHLTVPPLRRHKQIYDNLLQMYAPLGIDNAHFIRNTLCALQPI